MQSNFDQFIVLLGDIVDFEELMREDKQLALHTLQKYQNHTDKNLIRYGGQIAHGYFEKGYLATFSEIKRAISFALDLQKDFQEDSNLQLPMIVDSIQKEEKRVSSNRYKILSDTIVSAANTEGIYLSTRVQNILVNTDFFNFEPVENEKDQQKTTDFTLFKINERSLGTLGTRKVTTLRQETIKWLSIIGISFALLSCLFLLTKNYNYFSSQQKLSSQVNVTQNDAKHSIAVLPFQNLSEEATTYFADGVMEDILTSLAKYSGMKVISRTSSMQYQNTKKSLPFIAKELGVNYLLEGSIRQQGEIVKITVQLIDAQEDSHVWAQTYERNIEDIFEIQSEVSKKIASALNENIGPEISSNLDKKPTKSHEAYNALLEGRNLIGLRTKDALEEGLNRLNESLSFDPGYADALAEKATIYMLMSNFNFMDEKQAATLSEKNALAAIQLDSKNEVAYAVLASLYDEQRKWVQSESAFKIALQLNPNNAIVNYWYSLLLRELKRYNEAIKYGSLAAELDPLYPVIHSGHALTCLLAGRTDLAKTVLDKGRVLFDDFFSYHWVWGYYYLMLEDFDSAQAHYEKADLLNPDLHSVKRSLIYCKGKLGYTEEVESFILTQQGNTEEDFLGLANANAGLGRVEECLNNLKSLWLIGKLSTSIKESVKFKLLDGHEGFEELIKEMEEKERSS
ncbi:hypothetical protein [Portibacter marinus]|uniref:hypothetical protein n=1 Tax=Portibacter marinus TaxID=2898660 RepID=UPI001F4491EC|nr:hypothetical protein [Portibacter marinus]